jgi:hypothetical protein
MRITDVRFEDFDPTKHSEAQRSNIWPKYATLMPVDPGYESAPYGMLILENNEKCDADVVKRLAQQEALRHTPHIINGSIVFDNPNLPDPK